MIQEFQFYCKHNLGLAESTIMEYGKDLHLFVTWLQATAGINRWSQVTRPTVEQWVSSQHCNGTAPATIKRRVSAVRRLYQYAWLQGLCSDNPAKYVSTPKNAKRRDGDEIIRNKMLDILGIIISPMIRGYYNFILIP